jgi:hypothetical protein
MVTGRNIEPQKEFLSHQENFHALAKVHRNPFSRIVLLKVSDKIVT